MDIRHINQNLEAKRNDNFYLNFKGISENKSNLLGRQVREMEMPIINFTPIEPRHKANIQKFSTIANFDEISIQFEDDISGLTYRALYGLVKEQVSQSHELFGIDIHLTDGNGDITDTIMLKECFIQTLSASQLTYQESGSKSIISVTFAYYNIDYGDVDSLIVQKQEYFAEYFDALSQPLSINAPSMTSPLILPQAVNVITSSMTSSENFGAVNLSIIGA